MHKTYTVSGVVLSRRGVSEASVLVRVLTDKLGVVSARAQSVRKPGAKLAVLTQTGACGMFALVKGSGGWRITGGEFEQNVADIPLRRSAFGRIARIVEELCGEQENAELYRAIAGFARALPNTSETLYPALERLAALRALVALGYADREELAHAHPEPLYEHAVVADVARMLSPYTAAINRGIAAAGLR